MNDYIRMLMPQINPNEIEAVVTSVNVTEGQKVRKGDLIATVESTKATADLLAEMAGYVMGLRVKKGAKISVGEIVCYITREQNVKIEGLSLPIPEAAREQALAHVRITHPALEYAKMNKIDLDALPAGQLITLEIIRAFRKKPATIKLPEAVGDTSLIIYGGGGHGKSLIELIRAEGKFEIAGVVDDGQITGGKLLGVPWLGGQEVLAAIRQKGIRKAVNAVGGISSIQMRIDVFERLIAADFTFPAIIHPSAVLEDSCAIKEGSQIFPLAYVGSSVKVGFGCIINTGVILSHDCAIEDYVNISPGAILAGSVRVGRGTLIGMGVTINLDVQIGTKVRIGNSATVKTDVPDGTVVHAGSVWPA
jgi:acetyltransferase EpsM